jgi:ergot alkaloid biosynthesis protein
VSDAVLITGGTGKTGRRLAGQLRDQGLDARVAARGATAGGVRFDWHDRATWDGALEGVGAAYLVAPRTGGDPGPVMIDFIQAAMKRKVGRFVLLSGSPMPAGGPGYGQAHLWLQQNAADWTVLRPSWFMHNFSEGPHRDTIRDEDAIYSAAADGRIPFISADDIAAAAAAALTRVDALNADFILTGPSAISYDEAARIIGEAVGRPIRHRRISAEALAERHMANGLPAETARMLGVMDMAIAGGAEDRLTDSLEALTGRPAVTFEAFAGASAPVWATVGHAQ